MKIKKILAIILSVIMIGTMSVSVFAETYVINEFDENYVICNEKFAGGEISNNMVTIEGTHEVLDGFVQIRSGAKLYADLAADGKSVNDGIVNVAFNFEPSINSCGDGTYYVATQRFDFGGGFTLDAEWMEFGQVSSWLQGGKFKVGGEQLVQFNADGTGYNPGYFRSIGGESTAPSLYYKINAKINLNTNKINLTIVERETTKVNNEYITTEAEIVNDEIGNNEYDYTKDSFEYFSGSLESSGEATFYSLLSGIKISTEGVASYADVVGGIEEYPDGYIFEDKGENYTTLKNGRSYTGNVKATSGIVDVSYRFWPSESTYETNVDKPVSQTFKFGDGFSFKADWSSYGAGWWCINGKFTIGSQIINMNKDGEMGAAVGQFRPKDKANAAAPHAYYDILAKINLDTKKINITIEEHLETTEASDINVILDNAEFDYNLPVLDGFETSLATESTYMESHNSNLLIKADGEVAYDDKIVVGEIFVNEESDEQLLTDTMTKQADWETTAKIIDISYRFRPDMNGTSTVYAPTTQVFEFGDGFSFNAQWSPHGGAAWLIDSRFNIGGQVKNMNPNAWNSAGNVGWFRPKGYEPFAYYDISAQVNLDTKKIKVAIIEYLEMNDGTINETELLPETEYDYNSDSFNFFRTSLSSKGDTLMRSYISNLFAQEYVEQAEEPEAEFVENEAVTLKTEKGLINTLADFEASNSPSVNLKFKNTTGNDISAVLIIAYYKDNSIVKLDTIKDVRIDGSYEQVDYTYNFVKADVDADFVEAFVWNGITDISPLKVSVGIQ